MPPRQGMQCLADRSDTFTSGWRLPNLSLTNRWTGCRSTHACINCPCCSCCGARPLWPPAVRPIPLSSASGSSARTPSCSRCSSHAVTRFRRLCTCWLQESRRQMEGGWCRWPQLRTSTMRWRLLALAHLLGVRILLFLFANRCEPAVCRSADGVRILPFLLPRKFGGTSMRSNRNGRILTPATWAIQANRRVRANRNRRILTPPPARVYSCR